MAESTPATLAQLLKEQDAIQQKIEASVQSELDAIQARLDALASIGKYYRLVEGVALLPESLPPAAASPEARRKRSPGSISRLWQGKEQRDHRRLPDPIRQGTPGYAVANRRTKLKK
ncbi:MAG: hypothetical protein IPP47_34030 [Bryobacterales bacterium]|nr:hypothetical protein [Bryobacterales bacterium]